MFIKHKNYWYSLTDIKAFIMYFKGDIICSIVSLEFQLESLILD